MTLTKRYLATCSDILAIRVQCKCGATISLPIERQLRLRSECANCRDALIPQDTAEYGALDQLMRALEFFRESKRNGHNVTLEVRPPDS